MAEKIFSYAPANPIRAAKVITFDPKYESVPFEYQDPDECYYQPWKHEDRTTLQVLSDFVPTLDWYDALTDVFVLNTPFTVIPNSIVGKTYLCYEAVVVFSDFSSGRFYFKMRYTETPDNAAFGGSLVEIPGLDINLQVKCDGELLVPALNTTSNFLPISSAAGGSYSFQAYCENAPSVASPKANMVIKKDNVVIFSGNMPCTPGEFLLYTGVKQPGSVYIGSVVGCDGCADVPEVNIADNAPGSTGAEETWISDVQNVQDDQPNTILFEYTNSQNDFNVIFETGTIFSLRVEGSISLPKPEFNNVIYNDINENTTKLYGNPWTGFKLFIAYNSGVAPWIIDRVNRILACDQIKIENRYYEMEDGAKWEESRADQYTLYGVNIDIKEVQNRFLDKLQLGPTPDNNAIIIVSKSLVYNNQAVNLAVSNVFKDKTLLDCITFYLLNNPFVPFTLKLSTSADDSGLFYEQDFTEEDVSALGTVTATVREAFNQPTTLYMSGWTGGLLANVCVLYHQYDAPPVVGSVNPYKSLGLGAIVEYDPPTGQIVSVDFNLGTGLGNPDTDWFGWAVCDGRNGTPDKGGWLTRGYKPTYPDPVTGLPVTDYNVIGDDGGTDSHIQIIAEMPSHSHSFDKNIVLGRSDNARDVDVYTSGWEGSTNLLNIQNTGGNQAMDWRNKFKVGLFVKKIND